MTMAKYTAYFRTEASMTVTADVPDDVAADGPEAISEWIKANGSSASICARCSGWGQPYGLELGDWEPEVHDTGEHKGMSYVTDPDGGEVVAEPGTDS
jgi:hypothetical protein